MNPLLAGCNVLSRYPPGSFFSFYPAVMIARNSSVAETVYDLQRPVDPVDRLFPAAII